MTLVKKAVFLDRDGVICEDTHYVTGFDKLHVFGFAKKAIDIIHKKGYLAVGISNQAGIARGFMTETTVNDLNHYIIDQTGIDEIYYCPHLPQRNEPVFPYRITCSCRKPKPGMLLTAAKDLHIDLKLSFMVGDRSIDIECGIRAGTHVCGIRSSESDFILPASFPIFDNLYDFALSLK